MAYVEDLADKYDTYGKDREFKTTKRGTITISEGQGCYGWWIDQQKTCDLIVDLVEKGESAETEPVPHSICGIIKTASSQWSLI